MPVLQLPFDADGSIVEADLRSEVRFCIAAECDGIVVPALASEFMVLTDDERRRVVEIAVEEAAGRLPVIAGVAAPSAQGAAALARHAEGCGASALMALPPYIRRAGPDGVARYYGAIAEASDLPIVLQNAPPPFAFGIGIDVMLRLLAEVPSILYVKEERPPAGHHISVLVEATKGRLLGIFGGTAGIYLMSELMRGATGCMPSAAIPDALVLVWRDFKAGRRAEARARYDKILPLMNLEMSVLMAVSKEVLRRRGVFSTVAMRDPEFLDLDRGDMAEIDAMWPALEAAFAPGVSGPAMTVAARK